MIIMMLLESQLQQNQSQQTLDCPRVLTFANTDVIEDTANSRYYINFSDGHGLSDGQKVVFNKTRAQIFQVSLVEQHIMHMQNTANMLVFLLVKLIGNHQFYPSVQLKHLLVHII